MRKMLFFSVYHLDRSIAAIQGRPLGIRDETFDLQLPDLEEVEADIRDARKTAFAPNPVVSEIKLLFYHLPSQANTYAWPADHQAPQASLQQKLGAWRHELSAITSALQDASEEDQLEHRKHELKLTSQYFAAMVLLYQPSQTIPQPAEQSLLICYQCAASRLNAYNDLYHAESFYQSWRSVQGIFSSGATMIYCLWTSALVRSTVPWSEAMKDLRTATNLLSVGGEWWPSVKKGKESFSSAIDALFRKLDISQHENAKSGQNQRAPARRCHSLDQSGHNGTKSTALAAESGMDVQEIHSTFQDASTPLTEFPHVSSDFATADWSFLNDPAYHHDPQASFGDFDNQALGATDSAVEAFIAQFLNKDTAWNAF
ncbi:hypothetical protein PMIN04_012585 [Paraphaeosphaeria minitans]